MAIFKPIVNIPFRHSYKVTLVTGVLLTNLFVFGLAFFFLEQSYHQNERLTEVRTKDLSRTLTEAISGTIGKTDLILLTLSSEIEKQLSHNKIENLPLDSMLSRYNVYVPELHRLLVLNSRGELVSRGYGTNVSRKNFADRDYFFRLRDDAKIHFVIGKPVLGVVGGKWVQVYARRINNPDGSFAGVVAGSVSLEYFLKLFSSLTVGKHGSITLRDNELAIIARYPEPNEVGNTVGQKIVSKEFRELVESGKKGATYKATYPVDNIERIQTYNKISDYPYYINVGMATSDVLEVWRSEVAWVSSFTLIFILFTSYSSWGLISKWKREKQTEEELKKNEESVRKSRKMLSQILNSVPQSIFWKDVNCVYQGCNMLFAQRAGVTEPDHIIGKTDFDLPWTREESECYRADDREVMFSNTPKVHIIGTQHQPDGTTIWVDTTKIPLMDGSGTVEGILGVYEDISERKRIEVREQSRLSILEKIATGAPLNELLVHIVQLVEQESHGSVCSVLLANEAGINLMHGAAPSLPDFYNKAVNGLRVGYGMGSCGTAAYLRKRVVVENIEGHPFWKGFDSAREAGLQACWSEPLISSDGQLLGTLATYHRVPHSPDNDEISFVESVAYLTSIAIENKRAEEKNRSLQDQMRQMQKIEAIGQLTGGIAHDFNNMLTPIFVYAEMIRASISEDDPNIRKIDGLISSAHKAKDLTQKLLSFSRKQNLSMEYLDLNNIIRSLHPLLRSIIRENIHIDLMLSDESAHIFADKGQLEQILINLTVNAQDAIEGNGRITIQTGHIILDHECVKRNPGMKPGSHILLTFTDNGCGMNYDVLDHVFEPFFTTKEVGKGTGLGLATVYGLVKQHDGYVRVQSRVGEGTTFLMYFPEQRGDVKADQVAPPVAQQSLSGVVGKTILIVDDNMMVLELVKTLLESLGCKVLSTDSPNHALQIVDSLDAPIDLLISDVIMPEMNGPELYKCLTDRYPDLPILFISGYTFEVTIKDISSDKNVNFLPKPFTTEQLLHKIQQALATV